MFALGLEVCFGAVSSRCLVAFMLVHMQGLLACCVAGARLWGGLHRCVSNAGRTPPAAIAHVSHLIQGGGGHLLLVRACMLGIYDLIDCEETPCVHTACARKPTGWLRSLYIDG